MILSKGFINIGFNKMNSKKKLLDSISFMKGHTKSSNQRQGTVYSSQNKLSMRLKKQNYEYSLNQIKPYTECKYFILGSEYDFAFY